MQIQRVNMFTNLHTNPNTNMHTNANTNMNHELCTLTKSKLIVRTGPSYNVTRCLAFQITCPSLYINEEPSQ